MKVAKERFTAAPESWVAFSLGDEIPFDDGRIQLAGLISVTGKGKAVGKKILLKGHMEGSMLCVCDRCCDSFQRDFRLPFSAAFVQESGDDDQFLYEGNQLGLDDMVIHHVLLSLPMQLLCQDDCLGICPICYGNRNKQKCLCK